MTLASTTRRNDYIGNGAVDTYSYTFKIYDETDLQVTVKDTDDVETELTLTTHYTVTGVGETAGGSVALVDGAFDWIDADGDLESGYAITIRRVRPITQETDVRNQGSNFREDIEDEFDKQIMVDQQQQDEIDRSLKFSETSTYDGISVPDPEAGKVLAWNSDADALENIALTYTSGTFPGTFTAGVDASKAASPSTNDVYIATDTKILYVCYSSGTWTVTSTLSGADASKAASPKAGQVYLATDTGKVYFCFVAGTWTTALTFANTVTMSSAAIKLAKGADVASANALTLGADGNYFDITGTTAITSIGTLGVGTVVKLHFDGALTLTHHATDLILPSGANITTAAGDEAEFVEYASGDWRCTGYTKASGAAIVPFSPTSANALAGSVIQVVNNSVVTSSTGTTAIPCDDTIPQNTEGTEFYTLAITPTNASNKLKIDVVFYGTSSGTDMMTTALFQDSAAGALAAGTVFTEGSAARTFCTSFTHYMAAGTTSATTFKVRVGSDGGGTITMNGYGGARKLGGVLVSSITISEIKV